MNDDQGESAEPVVIPHTELSADALRGVIESFVLREGTDYGTHEYSLEQKVAHVLRQLERKEARILFDPDTETVHIVTRHQSMDQSMNQSIRQSISTKP